MDTRDDNSLLRAIAQDRDQAAFTELYERYRGRAFSFAFQILQDSALAADAVQEAMFSIWQSTKLIPPDEDACGWILRIVTTKSFDLGRNQRRRAKREERLTMERGSRVVHADELESKELIAELRRHIEGLPELERRLLACCYGANMSNRRVAELFDMSHPTVASKLQQILERLRGNLTDAGVAAVIPLLSSKNIFEAMTTGYECPPDLIEIISRRINSDGSNATQSLLRRAAASQRGAWIPFATGLAIVAAITGAVAWTMSGPMQYSTNKAAPNVAKTPGDSASTDQSGDIDLHWDFRNGIPDDMSVMRGHWSKSQDANNPGIQADGTDVALFINHRVPAKPMCFSIVHRIADVEPAQLAGMICVWRLGNQIVRCRHKPNAVNVGNGVNLDRKFYILGRYIVATEEGKISSCREYDSDYPGDSLCLVLGYGAVYRSASLKTISLNEIPENLRNPAQVMSDIKNKTKEHPEYSFPETSGDK